VAVTVRDTGGKAPPAIAVVARLAHPADTRRDRPITVRQIAPGAFSGTAQADPGQWDLLIDVLRDDQRLFHSKSRVTLR
jgi:nitrogen fixation protein FixH